MQLSKDAVCTWSHTQPSHHADPFSFPPIQRSGLPRSTAGNERSRNQETNLEASSRRLLDALSIQPLKHAEAL